MKKPISILMSFLLSLSFVFATACGDTSSNSGGGQGGSQISIGANGNSLFASGVATKYVYEQDSMWKYVDYTVTTSVTCVELEEGVYVVTESERWSKYNENGYYGEERPSDDVMANDGKIYHTSYIVK